MLQAQGLNPEEISSTSNPSQFWSDLFSLDVDGPYLADSLARISNEACLGPLKASLHTLPGHTASY